MFPSLTFVFTLNLLLASFSHPLHVSVTEIEMNEKEKRLEIMMRVFVDDLETTFRENYHEPELDIINPKGKSLDQMMEGYLKTHFKILLDNRQQVIKFLGHELEGEAFIFYIEVSNVKAWKAIDIQNDIITDVYGDQSNLVHVTQKETVRSLRLTRNHPKDKLTFD